MDALQEATLLGVDIQLKILQSLPSLTQYYGDHLNDKLITKLLQICSNLQASNKPAVVINTASATMQQLILFVFEKVVGQKQDSKVSDKDESAKSESDDSTKHQSSHKIKIDNGSEVLVTGTVYDAFRVLRDLCNLTEQQSPTFLTFKTLPVTFGLELFESILTYYSELFHSHVALAFLLRTRLAPLLLRAFAEKKDFPVTVRVARILYLLIRRHLSIMQVECEVILSVLTHSLDPKNAPYWKRLLCMEVFQGVCAELPLVLDIYQEYDQVKDRRNVVQDFITGIKSMATENPPAIGLGSGPRSFTATDGLNGASLSEDSDDMKKVPGLSIKTSTVRVAEIDLLDKTDPPSVPESYLYYLALNCVNSLADGILRFVTATYSTNGTSSASVSETNLPQTDVNSITHINKLSVHEPMGALRHQQVVKSFVTHCWSNILTIYTTYFCARTDEEVYNIVVKSIQGLAQACGIMLLEQPRDAFMLLLSEYALFNEDSATERSKPSRNILSVEGIVETIGGFREHRRASSQSAKAGSKVEDGKRELRPRNVACCKALINVGLAVGASLGTSWSIIFRTLQIADTIIVNDKGPSSVKNPHWKIFWRVAHEFSSVDNLFKKMLTSSANYTDDEFSTLAHCICGISSQTLEIEWDEGRNEAQNKFSDAIGSVQSGDPFFLFDILADLTNNNVDRFVSGQLDIGNLKYIVDYLLKVVQSRQLNVEIRERANATLESIILDVSSTAAKNDSTDSVDEMQKTALTYLKTATSNIVELRAESVGVSSVSAEFEIHISLIHTLNKILDHCGSKLNGCWDIVFDMMDMIFEPIDGIEGVPKAVEYSGVLAKTGFEGLQLVYNDFLQLLPLECLFHLINILYQFCHQSLDLNISFTATSLFWTVSDHLRALQGSGDLDVPIENEEDLRKTISSDENNLHRLHGLWMFALLRLADISSDDRAQVRNGSVQIFFRTFDAHGSKLPPNVWKSCHNVALPRIMSIRPVIGDSDAPDVTAAWIETMELIITGIGSVYSTFMELFLRQDNFFALWDSLLSYFSELVAYDQPKLSLSIYKALLSILNCFASDESKLTLPSDCLQKCWDFWIQQPIKRKDNEEKIVQDALVQLVQIYEPLYKLSNFSPIKENAERATELLEKCMSFPVLPPYYSDSERLSPLQSEALKQVKSTNLSGTQESQMIFRLLSRVMRLALETVPSDGFAKGEPNSSSFVSLCYHSQRLVLSQMDVIQKYRDELLQDGTIAALLDAVRVLLEKKFDSPAVKAQEGETEPLQLWQLSSKIFVGLLKVIITADLHENLWSLITKCSVSILKSSQSPLQNNEAFEKFDISRYEEMISVIETSDKIPKEFWNTLVACLFDCSFLYTSKGQDLFKSCTIDDLNNQNFNGSTQPLKSLPRPRVAYKCIDEMKRIPLARADFTLRCGISLRQFASDQPLRGLAPLPIIHKKELAYLMKSLLDYGDVGPTKDLYPLIVKCLTIAVNEKDLLSQLQGLLNNIHDF